MRIRGNVTCRGPFGSSELDKVISIICNHPFNTETVCCIPFVQNNSERTNEVEEVKRLDFEEADDEDEMFLSLSTVKTELFDDTSFIKATGFYYKIEGPAWLLLNEPFYSCYVAVKDGIVLQTKNTPVVSCNSMSIIGGKYLVIKLDLDSYQRLGISAKHADFRLIHDTIYLSITPLNKLSVDSKLLSRIRDCLRELPFLAMEVVYNSQDILFPMEFMVEKVLNTAVKRKVTDVPIPRLHLNSIVSALKPIEQNHTKMSKHDYEKRKKEHSSNRQNVLGGLVDWVGCLKASSMSLQMYLEDASSASILPSCFDYIKGNQYNYVNVYSNEGLFSSMNILQKFEFLKRHVDCGKSPFAVMSVFGSNCSAVQWLVGTTVSEYNYLLNDDAHYMLMIFPNSKVFVWILASDMESRL